GGAAAGVDAAQGGLQLADVVGEILVLGVVQGGGVVEIDDEDLVVVVGSFDEGKGGGFHFRQLIAHAAAVVDYEAEGHRNVLALELSDLLPDLILEDAEGGLREGGDEVTGF